MFRLQNLKSFKISGGAVLSVSASNIFDLAYNTKDLTQENFQGENIPYGIETSCNLTFTCSLANYAELLSNMINIYNIIEVKFKDYTKTFSNQMYTVQKIRQSGESVLVKLNFIARQRGNLLTPDPPVPI